MPNGNDALLPAGHDVPFAEIEATLARLVRDGRRRRRAPARALTVSVIVVGDTARIAAAGEALEALGEASGVRAILITEGDYTSPIARVTENTIAIAGLAPRYLNNAVAALRLSSLPAVVWWRGGTVSALADLANLADRLVLDMENPGPVWERAPGYFEKTALTDLRWTRLTRWRSALAHLFDLPQVRDAAPSFERLSIAANDRDAARLFAGWLRARLRWPSSVAIEITPSEIQAGEPSTPLKGVQLHGPAVSVSIGIRRGRGCLEAAVDGVDVSARIVPMPDGTLASLIGEELGVRTRDLAFEEALTAALEIRS